MSDNTHKIYGIYAGILTEKGIATIKNGSEFELYLAIDCLGKTINKEVYKLTSKGASVLDYPILDLNEIKYAIEYAAYNTRRFGVSVPDPKEGDHIQRTESYSRWIEWWDDYTCNVLTKKDYMELLSLVDSGKDHSKYRPKGTWM